MTDFDYDLTPFDSIEPGKREMHATAHMLSRYSDYCASRGCDDQDEELIALDDGHFFERLGRAYHASAMSADEAEDAIHFVKNAGAGLATSLAFMWARMSRLEEAEGAERRIVIWDGIEDAELSAMNTSTQLLEGLTPRAARRVASFLKDKFAPEDE